MFVLGVVMSYVILLTVVMLRVVVSFQLLVLIKTSCLTPLVLGHLECPSFSSYLLFFFRKKPQILLMKNQSLHLSFKNFICFPCYSQVSNVFQAFFFVRLFAKVHMQVRLWQVFSVYYNTCE